MSRSSIYEPSHEPRGGAMDELNVDAGASLRRNRSRMAPNGAPAVLGAVRSGTVRAGAALSVQALQCGKTARGEEGDEKARR